MTDTHETLWERIREVERQQADVVETHLLRAASRGMDLAVSHRTRWDGTTMHQDMLIREVTPGEAVAPFPEGFGLVTLYFSSTVKMGAA